MDKIIKSLLYIIGMVSFLTCIVVGVRRMIAENRNNTLQIGIKYEDVLNIAYDTHTDLTHVLEKMKVAGATTLFVEENIVLPLEPGDLSNDAAQGNVNVLKGYQLQGSLDNGQRIKPPHSYILTEKSEVSDRIYHHLEVKGIPVNRFQVNDKQFIEVSKEESLTTVGVGFPYKDLETAAALGYIICPQVREWPSATKESVLYVKSELEKLPSLGPIYFMGEAVPTYSEPKLIELIAEKGLGFKEFLSHKQKGFGSLAKSGSQVSHQFNVVRQFSDDNLTFFSTLDTLYRYELALHERGIRSFLFVLPKKQSVREASEQLQQNLSAFKSRAEAKGYKVGGEAAPYNLPLIGRGTAFIAGVGAIVIFIFLMTAMGLPKLGLYLGVAGTIGYALLLAVAPHSGVKLMALFGAIICPSYGIISCISKNPRQYKETVLAFLKIWMISFGGGLTIIGVLSQTSYALGVDLFFGVKAAYLCPILITGGVMLYNRQKQDKAYLKTLLNHKVTYLTLVVLGILMVGFFIYTLRLGNTSKVPYLEKMIRDTLTKLMGVRPRTKEFLIGYPLLIILLYFGYRDSYFPVLAVATIGPIALVNTYAHIHTPLMISFIRSGYGMLLGIIMGTIGIFLVRYVILKTNLKRRET